MTAKEVLELKNLPAPLMEVAVNYVNAMTRLKKSTDFKAKNGAELRKLLEQMKKNSDKRKERKEKKNELKAAQAAQIQTIKALIDSGKEYDFSFEDIIEAINEAMREKKNAAIRAKIAELEAQLV